MIDLECKEKGSGGNYYARVTDFIKKIGATGSEDYEEKLAEYSANLTNEELERLSPTCQALYRVSPEQTTTKSALFGYRPESKIYHEFMSMNAGLGNRKALDGKERMISCQLCQDADTSLNEIHVLMQCPALKAVREQTGIANFMEERSHMTARQLYRDFLTGSKQTDTLIRRMKAADLVREDYLAKLGTCPI